MGKESNIPVLSMDNTFLSYTNPAKARILINKGKAHVFSKDPFMIQLNGENARELKMSNATQKTAIMNFTKYFDQERDVYIQNVGNTQIALTFTTGPGNEVSHIIPKTRKPYNLTQFIPFSAIKNSVDFRSLMNRRPPIIRLMTEEEYIAYYENVAGQNNSSFDDEVGKVIDTVKGITERRPELLVREMEALKQEKEEALSKPPETHQRVIGLCVEADKEMGTNRLSAGDFIEELEAISGELSIEDWEFVQSKGVYKTVKDFATKRLSSLTTSSDEDE